MPWAKIGWSALAGAGALLMAAVGVPPEEAVSNLSKWAEVLGFSDAAEWLADGPADAWGLAIGATIVLGSIIMLMRRPIVQTIYLVRSYIKALIRESDITSMPDQDSGSIDVNLTPSSGQRPDVRLSVKNNGGTGMFSAQCQIHAARNDPNQLKTGVFNLPWQADREKVISISKGETQELLIARYECWRDPNFCQLEILEWTAKGPTKFWDARWDMPENKASLPEFDLEITIFQQEATEPMVEVYVLRPIKYFGPLEMIVSEKLKEII